jgi:hypothetical protein
MFDKAAGRAVNTSDADYKGYVEFPNIANGVSILYFVWYNKTQARYDSVKTTLGTALNWTVTDFDIGQYSNDQIPAGTIISTVGFYSMSNPILAGVVQFYVKEWKAKDGTVPKDTLVVGFEKVNN